MFNLEIRTVDGTFVVRDIDVEDNNLHVWIKFREVLYEMEKESDFNNYAMQFECSVLKSLMTYEQKKNTWFNVFELVKSLNRVLTVLRITDSCTACFFESLRDSLESLMDFLEYV